MLTIVEIILTVVAWRRGWKAWALLPLGVCFILALLLGAAVTASGGSVEAAFPVLFLLDLACVGVLLGLVTTRPSQPNK